MYAIYSRSRLLPVLIGLRINEVFSSLKYLLLFVYDSSLNVLKFSDFDLFVEVEYSSLFIEKCLFKKVDCPFFYMKCCFFMF